MDKKPDIIYEDKYILAVHKPPGLPSQTTRVSQPDVVSMTEDYLRAGTHTSARPFVGMINRLDQPVEGIVLMARDTATAAHLAEQLRAGQISKHYLACVVFAPEAEPETGHFITLTDCVYHDKKNNYSSIVSPDHPQAKRAELEYSITDVREIDSSDGMLRAGLADVHLITGRHHQIRVQMSHAGLSLAGDRKYGTEYVQTVSKLLNISEVALCACQLSFTHPVTNDIINLRVKPRGKWYSLFQN